MASLKLIALVAMLCVAAVSAQFPSNPAVVDMAMRNPRFMRRQLSCLLSEGPCDNVGRTLRTMTPGLLRGQCSGCTPQQFQQAMKVMNFVSRSYPQEYGRIYGMYMYSG